MVEPLVPETVIKRIELPDGGYDETVTKPCGCRTRVVYRPDGNGMASGCLSGSQCWEHQPTVTL